MRRLALFFFATSAPGARPAGEAEAEAPGERRRKEGRKDRKVRRKEENEKRFEWEGGRKRRGFAGRGVHTTYLSQGKVCPHRTWWKQGVGEENRMRVCASECENERVWSLSGTSF
jgi:hypothetical protein